MSLRAACSPQAARCFFALFDGQVEGEDDGKRVFNALPMSEERRTVPQVGASFLEKSSQEPVFTACRLR
ncbi:hypothetical protein D3C75_1227120 [compost metagenome]